MRTVVKVGTSTLTHQNGNLNIRKMEALCKVLADLKNAGHEIILVSSPESKVQNEANGNVIDTVPQADEKGKAIVSNDVAPTEGEKLVLEIRNAVEQPSIIQLLRNIY